MKVKSFSQCSDWYFVFRNSNGQVVNCQLAGFAVLEAEDDTDSIIGMVSVPGGGPMVSVPDGGTNKMGTCRLAQVPSVPGNYMHRNDINL
jgi:hypothetical protein